jgi:hypothetical protein
MIDFFPLALYYEVYLYTAFIIVLITFFHTRFLDIHDRKNINYTHFMGYSILVLLTLYLGLRPVSGKYFTDMITYARIYESYSHGGSIVVEADVVFHQFMKFCSHFLSTQSFFLLCATFYILPMYIIAKKLFKAYWFYGFLMLVVSFQFYTYGVNGIRNGMATSFFLLGLAYYDKKAALITFFTIAVLFHQTLVLPILAYVLTLFYKNPKTYLYVWAAAIPLSIALGSFWENLFASLGFADDRLGGYLSGEKDALITNTGFRYDFLLYSASAVFTGWYFIFKKNYQDPFYTRLFNIYVTANAFWILVIRANFSNRFAYLSWFLMGLVIIYPFIKNKFYPRPHKVIGNVLVAYFMFTYVMYLYYNVSL